MHSSRRRVFARFFLALLFAQLGLAAATWLLLTWGIHLWLQERGARLAQAAGAIAGRFTAAEVCAIPAGDTTSVAFTACLEKLQRAQREAIPRADATAAIFALVPGSPRPWLSIRVAEYPPYTPDEGKAPQENEQNDAAALRRAMAGETCCSAAPYGGATASEKVIMSGYAPLRDARGIVRAVAAVDGNVAPFPVLQEVTRTAFAWALAPAFLISLGVAWGLTLRFVDPMVFYRGVQEAALRGLVERPAARGVANDLAGSELAKGPAVRGLGEGPVGPGFAEGRTVLSGADFSARAGEVAVAARTEAAGIAGSEAPTRAGFDVAPPRSPLLAGAESRWERLSAREKEVVRYVGQAMGPKDMADCMGVAESTVKQHLKNVYRELEIHSREELVIISVFKFGFPVA